MRAAVLALFLALPLAARAQEINFGALDDASANRVHLRTGAEHGFVIGTGYTRTASVLDHPLLLTGDLTLPWASLDVADFRLRLGAMAPIVGDGRWKVIGGLAPVLRGTKNDVGRMIDVGADLAVLAGRYSPRWFLAGELGFDWAITTHVTHGDAYRELVYSDARDGWYASPGGNLRYGLQGGASFGRYDLVLRAGQLRDVAFVTPLLPFYATVTVNARW